MTAIVQFPDAEARINAAIEAGILKRGDWGNGSETVCMMSAIVTGARSFDSCVTAGWPQWLVELNVSLFDANVGADDEDAAAASFALELARATASPFDADKARDLFLIRRLDTGDHSALKSLRLNPVNADWWRDCEAVIVRVADLLRRRIVGEGVAQDMVSAYAAARAADAAARAAAYAAADAADAAARAAARAADAAARAVADAAYAAADAAARAAARADLITAINESRLA